VVPFNISAMAEASEFKIGMQLAFEKFTMKSHRNTKGGLAIWRFFFDISVMALVLILLLRCVSL